MPISKSRKEKDMPMMQRTLYTSYGSQIGIVFEGQHACYTNDLSELCHKLDDGFEVFVTTNMKDNSQGATECLYYVGKDYSAHIVTGIHRNRIIPHQPFHKLLHEKNPDDKEGNIQDNLQYKS